MNRVLSLQKLQLDSSVSLLGNSCTSSAHSCCNTGSQEPQ